MTDITVPTAPPLSNLPRVELAHAGQWEVSNCTFYCTAEDLANAVAAQDCPAVRRAILKLGHSDPRFNDPETGLPLDGQPAIGFVTNMATANQGQTLVGDFVGMPGWLGTVNPDGSSVIASAYPDRSIEGEYDFRCQIGHTHPFVIKAVALLGVAAPGIGTLASLQDIADLYGVAASQSPAVTGTTVTFTVRAATAAVPAQTGAMVALVPTDADAARLAVDGGEPADQLHLTLRYLGDAADISTDDQARIIDAVRTVAAGLASVEGDGFAVTLINPTDPDRETCIALGISGDAVDTTHDDVESAVNGLGVADLPDPLTPFLAHVTLVYTDDADQVAELVDRTGPITFDRLRVAFAGVATDIPLGGDAVTASRKDPSMPNPSSREVAAGVTTDDVRRLYYDDAPWSYWITSMELEPLQLIVTDDNTGKLFRILVTVSGEDIEFAPAVEVSVTYVDKPATPVAASAGAPLVYASRAESRPGPAPKASGEPEPTTPPVEPTPAEPAPEAPATAPPAQTPAAEPTTPPTTEEDDMSTITSDVRSRLGLADDADDDAILTALDAALAVTPEPAPVAASLPEGVVAIDQSTLDELRDKAELGVAARVQQRTEARDRVIDDAIKAGKIPPARREHWTALYDADPEGTPATLASLAAGLVPVASVGYSSTDEPDGSEADFDRLFPATTTTTPKG